MIYELEEAASIAAEEEEDDGDEEAEGDDREDEKAHRLRFGLSHSRSVPAHLEGADCEQMVPVANTTIAAYVSRPSSPPLPGGLFHRPLFFPSQIEEQSSSSPKTYVVSIFFHTYGRLNAATFT